ncbi:MAG: hypothetical protein ACO3GL_03805 [Bacteroidia bacterium]
MLSNTAILVYHKPFVRLIMVLMIIMGLGVSSACSSRRKGRNKKCNCPSIGAVYPSQESKTALNRTPNSINDRS